MGFFPTYHLPSTTYRPSRSPPANPPGHRPVPALGERLDLRLREAGQHDPELRDLQNVQGLLLR